MLNLGKMKVLLLGDPLACFWNISNMKALSKVGGGDSVLSVCLKQVTLTGDLSIGSCILEYGRSRPCSAVINNLKT